MNSLSLFPSPTPELPPFRSLLIHGPYHASAPIHLSLSCITRSEDSKAVIIAPSRSKFIENVKTSRDSWIMAHGTDALTSKFASNVKILYPPKSTHLNLVLASLHETQPSFKNYYNRKISFDMAPSLLILCELSSYILHDPNATVSSYLTLVLRALSTVNSLAQSSGKPASLVIFDSKVGELKLPLLSPLIERFQAKEEEGSPQARRESVVFLASKYIQWVGGIHEETSDFAQPDCTRRCKLELREGGLPETQPVEILWHEYKRVSSSDRNALGFLFE